MTSARRRPDCQNKGDCREAGFARQFEKPLTRGFGAEEESEGDGEEGVPENGDGCEGSQSKKGDGDGEPEEATRDDDLRREHHHRRY